MDIIQDNEMWHPQYYGKAPTKEVEIPIPEEIMHWIGNRAFDYMDEQHKVRIADIHDRTSFEAGAIAMYRKMQEEIAHNYLPIVPESDNAIVDAFFKGASRMQEKFEELQSALSSMTAERDEAIRVQKDLTEVILKLTKERNAALEVIRDITDARKERDEYRKVLDWIAGNENSFIGDRLLANEVLKKHPTPPIQ